MDETTDNAKALMSKENAQGKVSIALSKLVKKPKDRSEIPVLKTVQYQQYSIVELENGTIELSKNGDIISPVKPVLRELASQLNLSIMNNSGNPHNTRQLGSLIIKVIQNQDLDT